MGTMGDGSSSAGGSRFTDTTGLSDPIGISVIEGSGGFVFSEITSGGEDREVMIKGILALESGSEYSSPMEGREDADDEDNGGEYGDT